MIDNSEFSRVVTLNSPVEFFLGGFSPFVNKSYVSNLFSVAFSYLVICLYYYAIACNLTN